MIKCKTILAVIVPVFVLVFLHMLTSVNQTCLTDSISSSHAQLAFRRLNSLRRAGRFVSAYVHHVYGSSATVTNAAVQCEPEGWPDSWVGDRPLEGQHMLASYAAQQIIWRNQHPKDCAASSFLLYASDGAGEHGIGSTLHVATWALAKAIELDRVLIFVPTPKGPWTQGKFCEKYTSLHDCYFKPTSSCSYADIMGELDLSAVPQLDSSADQQKLKMIQTDIGFSMSDSSLVPSTLLALLDNSLVPQDRMYFWYRAQAVAFIVRPNDRTLKQIQGRKQQQSWVRVPDGAISVHIRHGDKGTEMQLVPDHDYVQKAEELVAHYSHLQRVIFLSTEDPKSVAYFKALQNWTIFSLEVPRPMDRVYSPLEFARTIGPDEEMLNSLTNLDLALDCSAWVGTIKSNWNRLIEELRSTVRCKAHLPYIDASSGWDVSAYLW